MDREGVPGILCLVKTLQLPTPTSAGAAQLSLCPHICKSARLGTEASFQVAGKTQ